MYTHDSKERALVVLLIKCRTNDDFDGSVDKSIVVLQVAIHLIVSSRSARKCPFHRELDAVRYTTIICSDSQPQLLHGQVKT